MNEKAMDRCQPGVNCLIETMVKVRKKFRRPEDRGENEAINRALIYATEDVELTSDDYRQIAEMIDVNRAKREAKRNKEKGL